MMFGYASNETEEYMPYAISLAHKLARRLTQVRKDGTLSYLRPDGKTQVTVEYDENDKPVRLDAVVLSTQHDESVTQEQIHRDIKKYVFDEILPADMVDDKTKFFINPTGRFVIGGPHGDSGTYGPENHRGQLLRIRPARRRRVFRKGLHQGGPLRSLRGPVRGQEYCGRRPGRQVRDSALLRHRRGPSHIHPGGNLWNRKAER